MKNSAKTDNSSSVALVTGASSGIGLALARRFAENGHPLVLVAPNESELEEIASAIQGEFGVEVTIVAQDLREPEAVNHIMSATEGIEIEILCNNAGLGQKGSFAEIPIEKDLEIIDVNVKAVVLMTKAFLPKMLSRGHGRILNTASVAGFEPGPTLAIYHATKAFVLSLSESLATELKETGVTLTALCPGPVDTDFFTKADMVGTMAFQKGNLMAPQEVAEAAYDALMKGERVVVPGGINKALVFSRRFTTEEAQAKMGKKQYEDIPLDKRQRQPGDVANAKR
jgi:short-subunit dehydrogenase